MGCPRRSSNWTTSSSAWLEAFHDDAILEAWSPLEDANKISSPVLIYQGIDQTTNRQCPQPDPLSNVLPGRSADRALAPAWRRNRMATFTPCRVMMMDLPAVTRASNWDRWVLASKALILVKGSQAQLTYLCHPGRFSPCVRRFVSTRV